MNDLEKYLDRVIGQKSNSFETPQIPLQIPSPIEPEGDVESPLNIGEAFLRRWYIVLLTFVVLCAAGIPAIWLLIQKSYVVSGAIRVDPIIPNILTGEDGGMSNYTSFMTTQAMRVTRPQVVTEVAKDLSNKALEFFDIRTNTLAAKLAGKFARRNIKPDPEKVLKDAILDELITARPLQRGEHIMVSMTWSSPDEAVRIVDSFIGKYMTLEGTSASDREEGTLATLEDEQKLLAGKLEAYQSQIRSMADEFGSKKLLGRYDMKLERVGKLLFVLTEVEAKRILLQTRVKLLENTEEETVAPEEWVKMREDYVNGDPAVQARSSNIVVMEQELVVAKQTLAPGNPQIKQKEELLDVLRTGLEEQKEKARETFNELMEQETINLANKQLTDMKEHLEQTQAHEDEVRSLLAQEDAETIDLGQKNLAITDLQDQLALTKELYDTISRRIQEVKMDLKRPARIYVDSNAHIAQVLDKRAKYTVAFVFGAMVLGFLLAFLKEKADRSLRTPDDVARHIGLRIIGTTTSTHTIKPARLPELVAGDYQAIRANLGLLEGEGMPRKLVVTSPGMQEGKTTFAVNLAISTSKSGKKVLLIDGDLRNPNIASLLGLPKGSRGLQDVLLGKLLHDSIYSMDGLDILAADSGNISDAFELLAASVTEQRLNEIARDYDHVIIDTAPVLAFADALVWAKVVDGVILTCFAGQTTGPNLTKARQRLMQINANVIGTVLSNVELDDSYHPYGYHYYSRGSRVRARVTRTRRKMLLPIEHNPKADNR
ncbi:MAG TPA: polysaccharide biosynthesis tyrosine autokinase [Sedimentisphaerales bacterium]|nr:polysaccharide biosynthesis tyrosine autokinase [Sedimentisphaerales bacterium]